MMNQGMRLMKRLTSLATLAASVLLMTGCVTLIEPRPNDPNYAPPVPAEKMRPPTQKTGSIYQSGYGLTLFETIRARHVGDILTVRLIEKTSAEKKATTSGKKDSSVDLANPTLLGSLTKFNTPKFFPLAATKDNTLEFKVDGTRSFSGEGESKQNNKLEGKITVHVIDVLPNNNLVIRGEKWLTLNRGKEYIRLTGIVRTTDIDADNSVASDRIADARISYSGTGQVADNNQAGLLTRLFAHRFFPF